MGSIEVIAGVFGFILTALGTILLMYFKDIKVNIKDMSVSMSKMNVKLEKVITDQSWHKEEIMEVKTRISILEK